MNKQEKLEKLVSDFYPNLKGVDKEKFIHIVKETGLDPLRNQIYVVERAKRGPKGWEKSFTAQTSIDGFRLIAERTGKYAPGREPKWNYDKDGNLESATAYVKKMTKDGIWHEVGATAYFDEYAQKMKDGGYTQFWKKMGRLMIAKCAEALALRKAFPDALSGVYTDDEMLQANQNGNHNDSQIDNQNDQESEKKPISKNEVTSLVSELNKVPKYRTKIEKFLEEMGITSFENMPKEMYEKVLNKAKELTTNKKEVEHA